MPNQFVKEERVLFGKFTEKFEDQLIISGLVDKMPTDQVEMARSNDTLWLPNPYHGVTYEGADQTLNFNAAVQTSVPMYINRRRSAPNEFTSEEYRDEMQSMLLTEAGAEKLASDINVSILDAVSDHATIWIKKSGVNDGFSSISDIAAAMNARGVPAANRIGALSSPDYYAAANNLVGTARSFDNETSNQALRDAQVGRIANINLYMLDYAKRLTPALGGGSITINTLVAGGNRYVPSARDPGIGGQTVNKDNRYQTVTVSSTANVKAGDAFTINGVEVVQMITKQSQGVLQTFRVMAVPSATTMVISPPIIDAAGPTIAEKTYGNVAITAPASNAAIVWLNTTAGFINLAWNRQAVRVLPGRLPFPTDAGVNVMRTRTKSGFELVHLKWVDGKTSKIMTRTDVLWGVSVVRPDMVAAEMFSQA